ncbi:MAG: DNA polymerase III subunit beta [Bacteroidetes bacterium]|nr:DNA polymerase III subunit beta [Bacteroidota bacterium]
MNFIISSSVLYKSLQAVSGVINSSNTLPILDNFLFSVNTKELVISASDLETTMSIAIQLEKANEKGNIAVPAKIILETLKSLSGDIPVHFQAKMEDYSIELTTGEGRFRLAGQNGDEFPRIPQIESPSKIEMNAKVLGAAIQKTVFATGNDDLRPVMSGVFVQLNEENVIFVATDAHRLVKYQRNDFKAEEPHSFIIPRKPLHQLKNILSGTEGNVTIEFNDSNAFFSFENVEMICRLIDGKYPNYEAVIPKENPNKLVIDRATFLSTLRRVAIFSSQSTHQVRLKIAGSELVISAEDVDYANSGVERLTCQFEGEDMEIGFNSRFLADMLANMDSENISLEMSLPNRAGILLPVEKPDPQEEVLMLVMPIMLNQ